MTNEEYGRAAYEEAQKYNYRYTEIWEQMSFEGKHYWIKVAAAVLRAYKNRDE